MHLKNTQSNPYNLPRVIYTPLARIKKHLILLSCYLKLKYIYKIKKLGKDVTFYKGFTVYNGNNNIIIGNYVGLNDVLINAGDTREGEIIIKDNVFFGTRCMLLARTHNVSSRNVNRLHDISAKRIVIEKGAWIASGVIILGGVTIGENAVVAAGAVVTKNVPKNTMYGGIPAKIIKNI